LLSAVTAETGQIKALYDHHLPIAQLLNARGQQAGE